jgi:hypothetical protein
MSPALAPGIEWSNKGVQDVTRIISPCLLDSIRPASILALNMIAGDLTGQLIQRIWEHQNRFRIADVLTGLPVTLAIMFLPRFVGYVTTSGVVWSSVLATMTLVALSYVIRGIRSA